MRCGREHVSLLRHFAFFAVGFTPAFLRGRIGLGHGVFALVTCSLWRQADCGCGRPFSFAVADTAESLRLVPAPVSIRGGEMESCQRSLGKTKARAYSSTAEQGTHNPLVAGSNPAGPIPHRCLVIRIFL